MSRLATRETTATSRSRSNGGCEIQRAKTKAPSGNASSFPKMSLMGRGGMTLPTPPALRLKVYSGCYLNNVI
jgi:hypothetical protein